LIIALWLCSGLPLAGCGLGAVEVTPYKPGPGSADICSTLLEALPRTVDDAVRRDVDPSSAPVAAWGQPAIVLRCGVSLPTSYRPDDQLNDIEGIGWLAEAGKGGTFFTAVDREVLVEVAIPDDYAPEADVLVDIAPAILATIRPTTTTAVSADRAAAAERSG
jgi:hypothetical protein